MTDLQEKQQLNAGWHQHTNVCIAIPKSPKGVSMIFFFLAKYALEVDYVLSICSPVRRNQMVKTLMKLLRKFHLNLQDIDIISLLINDIGNKITLTTRDNESQFEILNYWS